VLAGRHVITTSPTAVIDGMALIGGGELTTTTKRLVFRGLGPYLVYAVAEAFGEFVTTVPELPTEISIPWEPLAVNEQRKIELPPIYRARLQFPWIPQEKDGQLHIVALYLGSGQHSIHITWEQLDSDLSDDFPGPWDLFAADAPTAIFNVGGIFPQAYPPLTPQTAIVQVYP
jgi:hypothetical protein